MRNVYMQEYRLQNVLLSSSYGVIHVGDLINFFHGKTKDKHTEVIYFHIPLRTKTEKWQTMV